MIGFDSGFDVYLQKDRGAKDRGLRDEGRETPPSVWRWWERSKVQSVLGRLPRVCRECQVEIRSLFHSESANSILLSHCRQPPYSDLAFLNDPLSCSHPLPCLHSRPTGSQCCKNMQGRPRAQALMHLYFLSGQLFCQISGFPFPQATTPSRQHLLFHPT